MSLSDLPKLYKRVTKIGHIFRKIKKSKNQSCQKESLFKILYSNSFRKKKKKKIWMKSMIFNTKKYFENQNFEIFDEVVDNFGRSDDEIIQWKKNPLAAIMWFLALLVQEIQRGIWWAFIAFYLPLSQLNSFKATKSNRTKYEQKVSLCTALLTERTFFTHKKVCYQ